MSTVAVVLEAPERLCPAPARPYRRRATRTSSWTSSGAGSAPARSGCSGSGRMPPFPGMGYPLVPGYESVGRVAAAGASSARRDGRARLRPRRPLLRRCPRPVRRRRRRGVVVAGRRACCRSTSAWASTACCWRSPPPRITRSPASTTQPELIVGHGVLGRLLARLAVAAGGEPAVVWERNPERGDRRARLPRRRPGRRRAARLRARSTTSAATPALLDTLIARLAPRRRDRAGRLLQRAAVLRVPARPSCARPASVSPPSGRPSRPGRRQGADRVRPPVARRPDHPPRRSARDADAAYRTAFDDPACLKMILDWRAVLMSTATSDPHGRSRCAPRRRSSRTP